MTIRKTDLLEFIMELVTDPSVVHNIIRAQQNMRINARKSVLAAIDKRFPELGDIEVGGVNGELLRYFPIQSQRGAKPHPIEIPWGVAELAYSVYASRFGRSQSLEELARRGGFGPGEMDMFLPDWRDRVDELVGLRTVNGELLGACEEALFLGAYGIGCGGPDKENTARCIKEIKRIQEMLGKAIKNATAEGRKS